MPTCYNNSAGDYLVNLGIFSLVVTMSSRKIGLINKNTGMSLNDRFTRIQQKSKTIVEDELVRKPRMHSFNVERRPEVATSLLLNQEYVNRERLRVPLPPLPPPRTEIDNRIYNNIMHNMIRSSERLAIPIHDRLTRVPIIDDRRRIRRRRGPKTKVQKSNIPKVNMIASSANITQTTKSRKRQASKQKDPFPRKEQVFSKEDLDQQLDQFMSHTKQKRDEELNRVIQEHS